MMWRPNRTTVFKDGSNVSDICFQKQVFVSREKNILIQVLAWSLLYEQPAIYVVVNNDVWHPSLGQIQLLGEWYHLSCRFALGPCLSLWLQILHVKHFWNFWTAIVNCQVTLQLYYNRLIATDKSSQDDVIIITRIQFNIVSI